MNPNVPKVALLIETSRGYGRAMLRGIVRYARLHGPWRFYVTPGDFDQALPHMNQWGGTGIIARIETRRSRPRHPRRQAAHDRARHLAERADQGAAHRHASAKSPPTPSPPPGWPPSTCWSAASSTTPTSASPTASGRRIASWVFASGSARPASSRSSIRRRKSKRDRHWEREQKIARRLARAICPSPSASWRATTTAAGRCSTPAARPASRCRWRPRSSASTTTNCCANWPTRRCRASCSTPRRAATAPPRCSTA